MGRKIFQNEVWYHIEKKIEYDTEQNTWRGN